MGGSGLGALAWEARTFFRNDTAYVLYFAIGLLGLMLDLVVRLVATLADEKTSIGR